MNFIQIEQYMTPLEDFISQIESDEIYVDESGCAVMDLPNERVLDMAKKGKNPRRAVDNIAAILETYFQITAYCFSDDDLVRVSEEIKAFNRKIMLPLKLNTPIQRSAIEDARLLCKNYRSALKQAPYDKVLRVSKEIKSVIIASFAKKDTVVSPEDLRSWLFDWAKGINKEVRA